jgi:hypothetical protein
MPDYSDWLAHATDDLTTEQLDAFTAAADAYYAQPHHEQRDPEDAIADSAEDDAALTAILQHVLGESSLETTAREARAAQEALTGWVRAAAALGTSESKIAERSWLARDTVRKRLGK